MGLLSQTKMTCVLYVVYEATNAMSALLTEAETGRNDGTSNFL